MTSDLKVALVADKLRELYGNVAAVARGFGVTRQAMYQFIKDRPTLQAVAVECRESMKDNAESALYSAVIARDMDAVKFYLRTQGKDRGYVERTENVDVSREEIEAELAKARAELEQEIRLGAGGADADGSGVPAPDPDVEIGPNGHIPPRGLHS